jgi:hypothetical protein
VTDRGGLGRSLDDIRADIGMAKAGPPVAALRRHMARTAEALDRILEGADDNPVSEFGAEVSPEQLWARLILEDPEQRLAALRGLLAAAGQGARCFELNHEQGARVAELRLRELLETLQAGRRVRVLCVNDVPIAWVPEDEAPAEERH